MERMVDFMLKAINIKWDTDGDKEYIFTIGYWDKYLKYLSDEISKL